MTLDNVLNEVNNLIVIGRRDYSKFNDKDTNKILKKAYPYVKCQEDFDKIIGYEIDIMQLHHYYKPNAMINKGI